MDNVWPCIIDLNVHFFCVCVFSYFEIKESIHLINLQFSNFIEKCELLASITFTVLAVNSFEVVKVFD